MIARVVAAIAVAVATMTALAGAAFAETNGTWHLATGKRICIQDNGWTIWNDALPLLPARLKAAGISAVVWDSCASQPASERVILSTFSTTENVCAVTVRGSYRSDKAGSGPTWTALGVTYIKINTNPKWFRGCNDTQSDRRYLSSHEMGHALGLEHGPKGEVSVMALYDGWKYSSYTALDITRLAKIYR